MMLRRFLIYKKKGELGVFIRIRREEKMARREVDRHAT